MSPRLYIKPYKKYVGLCFLCWLMAWGAPKKEDPRGEWIISASMWETSPLGTSRLGTLLCDVATSFMGEAGLSSARGSRTAWIIAVTHM